MTKKSPEFFCQLLTVLQGTVKNAETCRIMGVTEQSFYYWQTESKKSAERGDSPSVYFFEWNGSERWLHEHIRACITVSIEAIEAAARGRALHGTTTTAKFQGKTVYKTNPDLEQLGFTGPDAYYRDANGQPIAEEVWSPPSTDLVLAVLAAHSKRYRKQSQVSIDMQARVSGGVMVVGGSKPIQQAITQAAVLPALEVLDDEQPAEAEFNEVIDDENDVDEVLDAPEPEPAPVPPPAPRPSTATGPLSELQRDLLSRLKAPAGSPERVAPPSRVNARNSDDYSTKRTGAGADPKAAGGSKVV